MASGPCLLLFQQTGYHWQQVIDWVYLRQGHIASATIQGVNKSLFDQVTRNEPYILWVEMSFSFCSILKIQYVHNMFDFVNLRQNFRRFLTPPEEWVNKGNLRKGVVPRKRGRKDWICHWAKELSVVSTQQIRSQHTRSQQIRSQERKTQWVVLKRSQGLRGDVRQADPGGRSGCHRSQTPLPCRVMDEDRKP